MKKISSHLFSCILPQCYYQLYRNRDWPIGLPAQGAGGTGQRSPRDKGLKGSETETVFIILMIDENEGEKDDYDQRQPGYEDGHPSKY